MKSLWTSAALIAGLFVIAGCGQQTAQSTRLDKKNTVVAKAGDPKDAGGVHKHDGWWCDEHGVIEAECSMCSAKKAKEFKAKGDWCDKHERAKSQCFICDPSLLEKAKVRYKAETGKEMPVPGDNMPEKN